MTRKLFLPLALTLSALMMTACAAKQSLPNKSDNIDIAVMNGNGSEQRESLPVESATSFADWKSQFKAQALAQGYEAQLVDAFLAQMDYEEQVVGLDGNQPEFSKMIWSYLDTAVSAERVANGRQKYQQLQPLLSQLEARYGVPGQYLIAIWGLESAYGGYMGNINLPSALATLAYDGRRSAFAQAQLFALLDLLASGDVSLAELNGSWAGGMGHTQFIPSTYLRYGVDANGDGKRSPWNVTDALASTANYLSQSDWQIGLTWGQEVTLPAVFDYQLVGQTHMLTDWQSIGIKPITPFPRQNTEAKLWLPGGHLGPAFLLYPNHEVIKVYNNSSSYALAVGLLADAIAGKPALQQAWPRDAQPLARSQVKQLQSKLNQLGYDAGVVDGILGSQTQRAFQQWQLANGQIADGFVFVQSVSQLLP